MNDLAVGEIGHARPNLSRQAEKILGGWAVWLNTPSKLAGKGVSDLIYIGAQRSAKRLALPGIVVSAADDPPDQA